MKSAQVYLGIVLLALVPYMQAYSWQSIARYPENPRVTIITSVYKSDAFIRGFLKDIVQQTVFADCELIVINANSPGNEEPVIKEYMALYPNITYIKLDADPGLYGVWNIGIDLARSEYVTNANTDDRLAFNCYSLHADMLDSCPEVDLVYSDHITTTQANSTMAASLHLKPSAQPEFSPSVMHICLPGINPMWRVSMHEKHGYFNEDFVSAGDWEMWCRAAEGGSVFKKVHAVTGLYYRNPAGLSTNRQLKDRIDKERKLVELLYAGLFKSSGKKKRVLATNQERTEKKEAKQRRIKKRKS